MKICYVYHYMHLLSVIPVARLIKTYLKLVEHSNYLLKFCKFTIMSSTAIIETGIQKLIDFRKDRLMRINNMVNVICTSVNMDSCDNEFINICLIIFR